MALKDVDIGVKILGGLVAVGLAMALLSDGEPEDDSWTADEAAADDTAVGGDAGGSSAGADAWTSGASTAGGAEDDGDPEPPADDPWTRDAPAPDEGGDDDDAAGEPPPDDPWTRGAPAPDDGDGDEDERAAGPPADDPWTRGRAPSAGGGGLPPCVGTMRYRTAEGHVGLPTDRTDEAFASADCVIGPGGSGDAVALVQVALSACNGQAVAVTAVHDEATSRALAAVQARHGLAADAVYGPATREAMAWPTEPDGGGPVRCISHPGVS